MDISYTTTTTRALEVLINLWAQLTRALFCLTKLINNDPSRPLQKLNPNLTSCPLKVKICDPIQFLAATSAPRGTMEAAASEGGTRRPQPLYNLERSHPSLVKVEELIRPLHPFFERLRPHSPVCGPTPLSSTMFSRCSYHW